MRPRTDVRIGRSDEPPSSDHFDRFAGAAAAGAYGTRLMLQRGTVATVPRDSCDDYDDYDDGGGRGGPFHITYLHKTRTYHIHSLLCCDDVDYVIVLNVK